MCLFALGFTACGGDEDGDNPNPPTPEFDVEDLYGGWECNNFDGEYRLYYFDEGNSGIMVKKKNADSENYERCDISYKVNSDVTTLTITEEEGDRNKYTILSLSGKKLQIEDEYEDIYTLKYYSGNIDREYPAKVTFFLRRVNMTVMMGFMMGLMM